MQVSFVQIANDFCTNQMCPSAAQPCLTTHTTSNDGFLYRVAGGHTVARTDLDRHEGARLAIHPDQACKRVNAHSRIAPRFGLCPPMAVLWPTPRGCGASLSLPPTHCATGSHGRCAQFLSVNFTRADLIKINSPPNINNTRS